ncbi:hypothetical protein QP561_10675, partial [Veillonella nakazawae]|nr:hypothetical protein [Veillonella nakazawae]
MVDGAGMCGACRITIAGKIRFACIDGPWFDGCMINWEELIQRTSEIKASKLNEKKSKHTITNKKAPQIVKCDDTLEELSARGTKWRDELRKQMKSKERMTLQHVP